MRIHFFLEERIDGWCLTSCRLSADFYCVLPSTGEVIEVVADWTGKVARATSAITELPDGSGLLFGSLGGDSVAFLEF